MASDEKFLDRWSRLKAESRERARRQQADGGPPSVHRAEGEADKLAPAPVADLPNIEELTADSDYQPFMRAEVPEELRRQALRKLWASDPALRAPDPLDMHALDDYSKPFSGAVSTLFRIGRGMIDQAEADKAEVHAAIVPKDTASPATIKSSAPRSKESEEENPPTRT
jgi:hypothetical protein